MGQELVGELRRRGAEQPDAAVWNAFYADLFSVQSSIEPAIMAPPLTGESVQARLSRRVPAVPPEDVRFDPPLLERSWQQVCAITAKHHPDLIPFVESIDRWIGQDAGRLQEAALYYLRGEIELLSQQAGLDQSLFQFLMNQTCRPFLRRLAQATAPWIDLEHWYQPYCPVCGGEPDFAVLRKPHGARWLLCSRCDFEWPYRRTSCPFCGCEDPEQYQYAPSEDNVYRLYLCDRCHRYLKTLDMREVLGERLPPVERVLTLAMDIAAHQAGYSGM